MQYLGNSKSLT